MPSGPHRPTLKSLAQGLGLSVSTVSKALKGAPDVGAQTVASVRMAAEAAGYVPDLRGVKLRTGQTFSLYYQKAVAPMQDVPDAIVAAQIETIASSLSGTPYQLQIVPWNTATEDPLPIIRRIVEGRLADGIVLDSTQPQDPRVRYLLERNFPFVTFGRTELVSEHPYVDADNEQAAFVATQYLAERGHQRIALVSPPLVFTYALQRRRGYQAALQRAGLVADPALLCEGVQDARVARTLAHKLALLPQPPTGYVCDNEVATLGVMAGLRDAGCRIGDDVELVSRDGASISDYLFPRPATLFLDIRTVASTLCDFLLRRIQGESVGSLQRVLPCELRYMQLPRVSADEKGVSNVIKLAECAEPVPNFMLPANSLAISNGSAS
jgi:LacI family transcriptional regulator